MAVRKEDIADLSPAELVERIQEEKRMLQKLRFNHEVSSVSYTHLTLPTILRV